MLALIADRKAEIGDLCARHRVKSLEVFGSAARGSDFDPSQSDVDFLVEFEGEASSGPLEQYFGLRDNLSAILGLPVDLIENGAIKNPHLKREIDRCRELVYAG
jgi:uncharacterized protein